MLAGGELTHAFLPLCRWCSKSKQRGESSRGCLTYHLTSCCFFFLAAAQGHSLNSLSLPLDEGLVLSTDREHALAVGGEGGTDDVLAVAGVAVGCVGVVNARVVVDVDEAPVVARDDELLVGAHLHLVNVSAILARRVGTLHVPTELDGAGGPLGILRVRKTRRVVSLIGNVEVELLVCATNGTDVGGVLRPIESSDERVVLGEGLVKGVGTIVTDRVNVKVVVVRGEGQEFLAGRVAGALAPLLSVLQRSNLAVEVVKVSHGDLTHVGADNEVVVLSRVADGSSLLVARVDGHRAGGDGLDFLVVCGLVVRHGSLAVKSARFVIVHDDLVIVAGCDHLVGSWHDLETPDFTLEVRAHDHVLYRAVGSHHILELKDGTIAETYQQVTSEEIDGPREGRGDVNELLKFKNAACG